jgi:hypothetical protein
LPRPFLISLLALYIFAFLLPRLDGAFDRGQPDEDSPAQAESRRESNDEPAVHKASEKTSAGTLPQPDVECSRSGSKADVTFYWQPVEGALEQWLDVSTQDNAFQRPAAKSAGPLPPEAASHQWDDLTDNVPWYWRVNTRTKDGWQASSAQILTPCGAQALASTTTCAQGSTAVEFRWTPAPMKIVSQWLDVSSFDNGFVSGTYRSVGPMSADTDSIVWDGLQGTAVVWRLNTQTSKGWISSEVRPISACDLPQPLHPRFTCIGSSAVVEFRWAPMPGSDGQWIDLSRQLNGFVEGTFTSTGRLDAARESFAWIGVLPNEPHYYRINAHGPNGWRTSVTRSFVAVCPGA